MTSCVGSVGGRSIVPQGFRGKILGVALVAAVHIGLREAMLCQVPWGTVPNPSGSKFKFRFVPKHGRLWNAF